MQKRIVLAAPLYLLSIIQIFKSAFADSSLISVGVKPKRPDAETPDDFFSATVFPLEQIDRHYEMYGSPIYELDARSLDRDRGKVVLALSVRWCERAFADPYAREPFLLPFGDASILARAADLFAKGPLWIQSGSAKPLAVDVFKPDHLFEGDDVTWRMLMKTKPMQPIYHVLSLDDNCTATVQLDPRWLAERNEFLASLTEQAAVFA